MLPEIATENSHSTLQKDTLCASNLGRCLGLPVANAGVQSPHSLRMPRLTSRPPSRELMTMLSTILAAFILVAITMVLHIVGLVALLMALVRRHAQAPTRFWPMTLLLIEVAWGLVLIHATEIGIWAIVLPLGGMPAGCRVGALFLGSHLRDRWLRRCRIAATMADARTHRGLDGNPDVRTVRRSVFCDRRQIDRAQVQG